MTRTISLGQITLTKLRNYHWVVRPTPALDTQGQPTGQWTVEVSEVYVVTDEDYSKAPEGQRNNTIVLTPAQTTAVLTIMKSKAQTAAIREQVDLEQVL